MFSRYGAAMHLIPDRAQDDQHIAAFFSEYVLKWTVEYRFVDALTAIARCRGEDGGEHLPPGSEAHAIACTQGPVTWIVGSLFKRMNIREQAKTIIHERMHALPIDIRTISSLTLRLDWPYSRTL